MLRPSKKRTLQQLVQPSVSITHGVWVKQRCKKNQDQYMKGKLAFFVPEISTSSYFGPCDAWLSTFNLQLIEMYTFDPSACESSQS